MPLSLEAISEQLLPIWPEAAVCKALREVELLDIWLARQIERQLLQLTGETDPTVLRHQWFGEQAASLFLERRAGMEEVLLSVLQLSDGHLAQELWFRLQTGEAQFPELSIHGLGPERDSRLGPLPLAELEPTLVELLAGCRVGELAPPLQQQDGSVLLLRLEQRWPARLNPSTRTALEQELYQRWLLERVEDLHRARGEAQP